MDLRIPLYLIFIFLFVIFRLFKHDSVGRNIFLFLCCTLLFLEAGLRHLAVGPDTPNYYDWYYEIHSYSWDSLLQEFNYFSAWAIPRDPGFPIIMKSFAYLGFSWQQVLLSISAFFFLALYRFISRNVETLSGALFALVLYISLFHIVALSGIRQEITMAVAMFSVELIEKRKPILFHLLIILFATVHISILFFLPMYILSRYISSKGQLFLLGSICLIPYIYTSSKYFAYVMADVLQNDYYYGYSQKEINSSANRYIILASMVSVFVLCMYRKVEFYQRPIFVVATIFMTLFVPLVSLNGTMIRIGQYFTFFMMLFLPYILDRLPLREITYFVAISILITLSLLSTYEYYFYWEEVLPFKYYY